VAAPLAGFSLRNGGGVITGDGEGFGDGPGRGAEEGGDWGTGSGPATRLVCAGLGETPPPGVAADAAAPPGVARLVLAPGPATGSGL